MINGKGPQRDWVKKDMSNRITEDEDNPGKNDGMDHQTAMATARERLTVRIDDDSLVIVQPDENGAPCQLRLTPGDALMLLDILQNESEKLEAMAAEAAPIPIRFDFRG